MKRRTAETPPPDTVGERRHMRGIRITEPMTEPPSDMPPPSSLSHPKFFLLPGKEGGGGKSSWCQGGSSQQNFCFLFCSPPSLLRRSDENVNLRSELSAQGSDDGETNHNPTERKREGGKPPPEGVLVQTGRASVVRAGRRKGDRGMEEETELEHKFECYQGGIHQLATEGRGESKIMCKIMTLATAIHTLLFKIGGDFDSAQPSIESVRLTFIPSLLLLLLSSFNFFSVLLFLLLPSSFSCHGR